MEDMNDMLGSLLSDPESMQQIKELADMLKSEMPSDGKSGESGQNGQSSQGGFDFGSLAGLMGFIGLHVFDGTVEFALHKLTLQPFGRHIQL